MKNLNQIINLINSNQIALAETELKTRLKFNKNCADSWDLLGVIYKRRQQYVESEKAFKKAIKLNSKRFPTYNNLANLYSTRKDYKKSIAYYKKAIAINPLYEDAMLNLASDLYKSKYYGESLKYIKKIKALYPNNNKIILTEGLIYLKKEEFEKSISCFQKLIEIEPNNIEALQNISICYKQLGLFDKALAVLSKLLSINSNVATAHHTLATVYTELGSFSKAEKHFKLAIDIEPANTEHHHWLSSHIWKYGNKEKYLNSYKRYLKVFPHDEKMMLAMADKYRVAKQYEEAGIIYQDILKISKKNTDALVRLAICQREMGLFGEAFTNSGKAYTANKNDFIIAEEHATNLIASDRYDEAIKLLNRLIKKDKYNQGLWALKSTALRLVGSSEYDWLVDYENLVCTEILDIAEDYNNIQHFNELLKEILKGYHLLGGEPLEQSLKGGTQTIGDLFNKEDRIISHLKTSFYRAEEEFFNNLEYDEKHPVLSRVKKNRYYNGCWSVCLTSSGYHRSHFHSKGWYSGPYYVSIPNDINNDTEGCLLLGKPGFRMATVLDADFTFKPEEGMLVRFPSMFWHGTTSFESKTTRMTVTCDIEN